MLRLFTSSGLVNESWPAFFLFPTFGPGQGVSPDCCNSVGVIELKNTSKIDKNRIGGKK
jgi:hypothetical protein